MSRDAKSAKGVLLGFDYGTVRVGLAVTDPDRIIASPLETYARQSDALDAAYCTRIATERRAVALVVGLPLHANGDESEKSREARTFGAWLSSATGLTVIFWDERFTTALADDVLDATRNEEETQEPSRPTRCSTDVAILPRRRLPTRGNRAGTVNLIVRLRGISLFSSTLASAASPAVNKTISGT